MSGDIEQVTDDDGSREYKISGKSYPSVTTILNLLESKRAALEGWREYERANGNDPDAIRDRAAIRGTLVHHRVLNPYAIRELPQPAVDPWSIDADMRAEIDVALELWDTLDFEVADDAYVERKVYSHEHAYAGTADLLTAGCVCDLKTSSAIRESHLLQISAYFHAIREMSDMPNPTSACVIRLDPDLDSNPTLEPAVRYVERDELDDLFEQFLALRRRYDEK